MLRHRFQLVIYRFYHILSVHKSIHEQSTGNGRVDALLLVAAIELVEVNQTTQLRTSLLVQFGHTLDQRIQDA